MITLWKIAGKSNEPSAMNRLKVENVGNAILSGKWKLDTITSWDGGNEPDYPHSFATLTSLLEE